MMHEVREQAIFVRREPDRIAVDRYTTCAGIESHGAAIELTLAVPSRTSQQCADARQNLLEMKRLCDVIVSASIAPLNLITPAAEGGQVENLPAPTPPPPTFNHTNTVPLNHATIHHSLV